MQTIININLNNKELEEATEFINANKKSFKVNQDMIIVISNDTEILVLPRRDKIILQTKVSLEM